MHTSLKRESHYELCVLADGLTSIGWQRPLGSATLAAGALKSMPSGRITLSFDAIHDRDADVWVATSAEARITTEADSRDELIERLKVIVPDVLESRLGHAVSDVSRHFCLPPRARTIIINWQELRTIEQTELVVA
jgi:hypothetical protein